MILLKKLLSESLDTPYKYSHSFKTELIDEEDEETGEIYKKEVLSPVQIVKFKTEDGIPYLWYARQARYNDTAWNMAFGVETGIGYKGEHQLDIGITKTGHAARVFSTVIDIINSFINFDDAGHEIRFLIFTAKEKNRSKFYINRVVPRIENFKIDYIKNDPDETEITLVRTN